MKRLNWSARTLKICAGINCLYMAIFLAPFLALAQVGQDKSAKAQEIPWHLLTLLPKSTDESGFKPLFGKTANDGWAQCGPGHFTLAQGVAKGVGGMGLWWHTNRMYTNFVLRLEWVQEQDIADSGVFVRFPHPQQDPWIAVNQSHEVEIGDPQAENPTWRTGAIYPFSAPSHVPVKAYGQWNQLELLCVGHTYVVRINGETVNVWTDPRKRSTFGYIGLQNYNDGKTVRHRNLRIKELD